MIRAGSLGSALGGALSWTIPLALALLGAAGAPAADDAELDDTLYVSQITTPQTGDLAPGAAIVQGGRPLTIDEAVALAIQNNLDVEVARYGPLIAEADKDGAWGAYDPTLNSDFEYDVTKSPNTFNLNSAAINRERSVGGGIGVDQLIPYLGASLNLRYQADSTSTRSTIQSFDPQYNNSFFMTATVPLMRDLIWNEPWTQVKTLDISYAGARFDFQSELMDRVQETVNAYWQLVARRDAVRVAQKSLDTARALLEQSQTQYEVGVVSRVDVVQAEAGVADRELQVIEAANEYRNAQDELIDVVLGRELSALTDLHFAPTEDPAAYRPRQVDVDEAVRVAFSKRPELMKAQRDIEQGEIDLKFRKNQRLPQLDAEVRFGYVGIGGEPNNGLTFGAPPPRRSFDDSHDDYFESDGAENFRAVGRFSIPIPNTTARKRVVRSRLELQRSKTREARTRQEIVLGVRRAARTLLASAQGIEAAERGRLAAEEQLRAERIRLEHGESTPFEVLQREEDLVEAESQKIEALRLYRTAEIGLERVQGTILDFHRVVVDLPPEPTR